MLTKVEEDLIELLKAFGLDMMTTVSIVDLCETDENRRTMIKWIIAYYDKHGQISEDTIQKMGLRLTGDRKK